MHTKTWEIIFLWALRRLYFLETINKGSVSDLYSCSSVTSNERSNIVHKIAWGYIVLVQVVFSLFSKKLGLKEHVSIWGVEAVVSFCQ